MKIILQEDLSHLGKAGDVVDVRRGYARNFLIPRGLADEANPKNIKMVAHQKAILTAKIEKERKRLEDQLTRLSSVSVTFRKQAGEHGKLFGSVTVAEIAKALQDQGHRIDRRSVRLERPIKSVGTHLTSVRLGTGVYATVSVLVEGQGPPVQEVFEPTDTVKSESNPG